MSTRYSSQELSIKLTEHIEELAKATDAARMSETMLVYLEMCSRFHRYNPQNVLLIMIACPDATFVAGYKRWQEMGRYVRKGERGIPILAPVIVKVDDDGVVDRKLIGFRVVYVFDQSQIDGEPLPEPPNWKSPEQNELLAEQLIHLANVKGIIVSVQNLPGDTQGVSTGGSILLSPSAGTKTLIHEIAHEMMHRDGDRQRNRPLLELEAESVAYVISRHFGLDNLASPNYVALHGATAEMIMQHLERIRDTAVSIINVIEQVEDPVFPVA